MSEFTLDDAGRVAAIIKRAATDHVLPYFRAPDRLDIRCKSGPSDLVTAADLACERALTQALTQFMPDSLVVGEEAVAADASVLDRLDGDRPVWILDPVDGTMNFSRGNARFAVIVALVVNDQTVAGWIHDPIAERLSLAVRGAGCFTEGVRIKPPLNEELVGLAELNGAISSRFCDEAMAKRLRANMRHLKSRINLGSAGQEYLHLLDGDLHASLYHRLMPWDHAAGVLLFAEAGGYSAMLNDGAPYRPKASIGGGALLSAPNRETWEALRRLLLA